MTKDIQPLIKHNMSHEAATSASNIEESGVVDESRPLKVMKGGATTTLVANSDFDNNDTRQSHLLRLEDGMRSTFAVGVGCDILISY